MKFAACRRARTVKETPAWRAIPDSDVREDVFKLAVRENWTILEMIPETQSLEEVFHKLTAA